jgi:hypothetical protein
MPTSSGIVQPRCNVLYGNHQLRRQTELHHNRLRNIKTEIDASPPGTTTLIHLDLKANTVQLMNDRFDAIRKENLRLYHKMMDIKEKGTVRTGGAIPLTVTHASEIKCAVVCLRRVAVARPPPHHHVDLMMTGCP